MRFQSCDTFEPISTRALLEGRPLTVLAPHPDDETLGCGNLLAAAVSEGIACQVICITDGTGSHPNSRVWPRQDLANLRENELRSALRCLASGIEPPIAVHFLRYQDCNAPSGGPAAETLTGLIPRDAALFCTWGGDPHIDHLNTARLANLVASLRPDLRLFFYPIWGRLHSELAFPKQGYLLTDRSPFKAPAIACHKSQMTRMIHDDPAGFVMDPELQALFAESPEVFFAAS